MLLRQNRSKKMSLLGAAVAFALVQLPLFNLAHADSDQEVAEKLTTLFRSARAVVSKNKDMIGDPSKTPDSEKFLKETKKIYARNAEKKLVEDDEPTKAMLSAIEDVVKNAKTGKYTSKWTTGKYPNKFLPARFAHEVAETFTQKMIGKMAIRLTVSDDLLVNPENKADAWESKIIAEKFRHSKMGEAKSFEELSELHGQKAYRYLIPEYYDTSCLSCHGGAEGASLHPGKISGEIHGYGGSISFAIFKNK